MKVTSTTEKTCVFTAPVVLVAVRMHFPCDRNVITPVDETTEQTWGAHGHELRTRSRQLVPALVCVKLY